jgi:hypothetical protein
VLGYITQEGNISMAQDFSYLDAAVHYQEIYSRVGKYDRGIYVSLTRSKWLKLEAKCPSYVN